VNEIVLIHGAWQGAWCWQRVVPLLEGAGRVVLTPNLTGSGERAAELSPTVTLARHVDDVVAELVDGDRRDVVLVGHSYSGMVITGVAERVPDRLAGLVFVDAFYPSHAESAMDQMPPQFQDLFRRRAEEDGEGWRLPANDGLLDVWGLHDSDLRAWVRRRLTDWSLNCFISPVDAPTMQRGELPRSYLAADAEGYPAKAAFGPIATKAEADDCQIHRFDTGHDIMLEAPREFADVLLATSN
jgi:pimeloyl-ACP methyl ester carboxylesterase